MQGNRTFIIAAASLALLAAGCGTPRTSVSPTTQSLTAQADRLMRDRQFANAAHVYEDLAQRASADTRNSLLLRAARAWLRAEDLSRGENLLQQVGTNLPPNDAALRSLAAAEAALLSRRPERALIELERIPQPYPRELAADALEVRARAQFAYGRPTGGVTTALDRERLLGDPAEITRNRKLIWDGIQRAAAAGVDMQAPVGASRSVAGWLELGRAAVTVARNPFAAQTAMNDWRTKYPEHPANEFLTQTVLPQIQAETVYPSDVALILPLSGSRQLDGAAVRDGFVAAFLQQPADQRPVVRVYDSAGGAAIAYARALTDGARFVVGPLMKSDVKAVAETQIAVPTLALNYLPEDQPSSAQLFQFSLDPTDEARQVAARAVAEEHLHGIALLPNNDWGQSLHKAFDAELRARGGTLTATRFYDPATTDFSQPVAEALLITESRARLDALQATLGAKLQFEPRRRGDVEFIFAASLEPQKGRLLRPALRLHLPAETPIYATSNIYEPAVTANTELDGIVFPDMPWMIAPDEISAQLRTTLQKYWPTRERERGRLYAFGFDAFRLIPRLQAADRTSTVSAVGLTGRLALDNDGRIRRDLDWARIVSGKVQPAPAVAISEAANDRP